MANDGRIEQRALSVPVAEPRPLPAAVEPLTYPDSDGHFLPDNPLQANAVVELRNSLREHFHGVPNVVVEGDMFLYYAKGEADERLVRGKRVGKYVAPDLIVVLDHDLGDRQTYKVWEEGKPPDFALEVISPSSEVRNRVDKKELYARIGIGEYFVFQPNPERAGPQLVGYALEGSGYRALRPEAGGGAERGAGGVVPAGRVVPASAGPAEREGLSVAHGTGDAGGRGYAEGSPPGRGDSRTGRPKLVAGRLKLARRAEETAVREAEARKAAEARIGRFGGQTGSQGAVTPTSAR